MKRTAEATANNLIMGASGAESTPPRNPKPKRAISKAEGALGAGAKPKKDPSDFVFRPSPLTRSPPSASKFVAHPTLTHLPQAFTSPPVRDGLLSSLRDYLSVENPRDADNKLFRPTPIQRLVLGHFFDDPTVSVPVRSVKGRHTPQQRLAITAPPTVTPRGMRLGSKTLLAAETGSGKTVAYALPIIEALKNTEEEGHHVANKQYFPPSQDEPDFLSDDNIPLGERRPGQADRKKKDRTDFPPAPMDGPVLQPRALILAPTHELARQIAQAVKVLSHGVKLRVACLSAGSGSGKDHGASTFHPQTDIVVGTIGRVRDLMGMSGLREEEMEARRKEIDNLAQIAQIKATTKAVKGLKESAFDTIGRKGPWVPDRRLTWEENLKEKAKLEAEGAVEKGMDPTKRPSWSPQAVNGRRRPPPAEEKQVYLGLDKLEWLAIDEADIVLSTSPHHQPLPRPQAFTDLVFASSALSRPRLHRAHRAGHQSSVQGHQAAPSYPVHRHHPRDARELRPAAPPVNHPTHHSQPPPTPSQPRRLQGDVVRRQLEGRRAPRAPTVVCRGRPGRQARLAGDHLHQQEHQGRLHGRLPRGARHQEHRHDRRVSHSRTRIEQTPPGLPRLAHEFDEGEAPPRRPVPARRVREARAYAAGAGHDGHAQSRT